MDVDGAKLWASVAWKYMQYQNMARDREGSMVEVQKLMSLNEGLRHSKNLQLNRQLPGSLAVAS